MRQEAAERKARAIKNRLGVTRERTKGVYEMNSNLAYQDDAWEKRREELIDGKVFLMAPAAANHILVSGNIYNIFRNYLKGKKCVPFMDGMKVFLSEKNHFVPDMMVVCDRDKIKRNGVHGTPDLVVEVLSHGTAKNDRSYKKDAYERSGVPEYWIVDLSNRSVEVYLLEDGRYKLDNIYILYSAEELEDMTDEEKSALVTEFKCHLYDDLIIRLDDIFYDLI